MSERKDFAGIGQRWGGWAKIISAVIAMVSVLLTLLGGGAYFYNEVWQSKVLTYTVLPTHDLGDQFFTGLIIENRGRVTLTDVQIILSDLDAPMNADPYMPGTHEPVHLISGGMGQREASIQMPRLSSGVSSPIYVLCSGEVELEEGVNFLVSSNETRGVDGVEEARKRERVRITVYALGYVLVNCGTAYIASSYFYRHFTRRDREDLEETKEMLIETLESLGQTGERIEKAEQSTQEIRESHERLEQAMQDITMSDELFEKKLKRMERLREGMEIILKTVEDLNIEQMD